jgi:uncharacterized protein YcaQ
MKNLQNTNSFFQAALGKWAGPRPGTPFVFDVPTLMDTMRKNIQTMATAQQLYIDSLQVVARAHGLLITDLAKGQGNLARTLTDSDAPEDKIGDQALVMKHAYERFHDHMRELQDMMYQSNRETSTLLSRRIGSTLGEVKTAIDRAKEKRAA